MAGIKGFLMPGHLELAYRGFLGIHVSAWCLVWFTLHGALLETNSLWLFVGKGTWVPSMGEPVGWGQSLHIGDREAAEISELTWIQRRPCATFLGNLVMVRCHIVCGSCRD